MHSRALFAAAAVAFVLKIALTASTIGTLDVQTFERMVAGLNERGVEDLYRTGTPMHAAGRYIGQQIMNHPPFVLHVLRFWDTLAGVSGLPLRFWMRATCAVADVIALWLVWRMSAKLRADWPALLLLALSPVSILISGFHGNTDPILIALVVVAVYLLETRGSAAGAGAAFGAACSIKVWPLVLLPAFVLYTCGLRAKILFGSSAALAVLLLALPWIITDGALIAKQVLGYGSIPGTWGLTYVLPHPFYPSVAVAMWACVLAAQSWMYGRIRSLYVQCAVVTAVFLFVTPGFGTQYLAWLVPWLAAAGWRFVVPFHFASGAYLLGLYIGWSGGWLYYADGLVNPAPAWSFPAGLVTWATLPLVVLGAYLRHARPLRAGNPD